MERPKHLFDSPYSSDCLPSPVSNKSFSTHSYASVPIDPISPFSTARCGRCKCQFANNEEFLSTEVDNWHKGCFRCAHCFELLTVDYYYNEGRRIYCEYDFKKLYAPTCHRCGEYILGRIIKVSIFSWHPECLLCERCEKPLESDSLWNHAGSLLCSQCIKTIKKEGGKICAKCKMYIEPNKSLRYEEEYYHGYHFQCKKCKKELDETARILKKELYCQKCYDHLCLICSACKRPIDNERSICALNKHWHIQHFVCAKCERPLYNSKYCERKDRAYCESCYSKQFAILCYKCGSTLIDRIILFNKEWCPGCYNCSVCDRKLTSKSKVIELDMRPVCAKCYSLFPKELKKRLER